MTLAAARPGGLARLVLLLALLAIHAGVSPAAAEPSVDARRALEELRQAAKTASARTSDMLKSVQRLAPFPSEAAAKLLLDEVWPALAAQDPNAQPEKDRAAALEAIETLVVEWTPKLLVELTPYAGNLRVPGRVRAEILQRRWALMPDEASLKTALDDAAWHVRVAALNYLASAVSLPPESMRQGVVNGLTHTAFRVRAAALPVFERMLMAATGTDQLDAAQTLIGLLEHERTRLRGDFAETLSRVAKRRLPPKFELWKAWLDLARAGNPFGELPGLDQITAPWSYYGIPGYGHSVLFILDVSASMTEVFKDKPAIKDRLSKTPAGAALDWPQILTKYHLARAELSRCLAQLVPAGAEALRKPAELTQFNVLVFADGAKLWQAEMQPATKANIDSATTWFRTQPFGKLTNINGALSDAFALAERQTRGAAAATVLPVDTIFFLTDGFATGGKFCCNGAATMNERLDRDRDVQVSRAEFDLGFAPGRFEKAEIDRLFAELDTTHDGVLSADEFNTGAIVYYRVQMAAMLRDLGQRNAWLKIRIHCLGIGDHDAETLTALAKQTGGEYINLGQ